MTSKEMEARSGVPRANIRYYEAEGLLTPARAPNGYRAYSEADLAVLEKIKLLRRLGVSVEELKALQAGTAQLPAVLDRRLAELGGQRDTLDRVEEVCGSLRDAGETFAALDAKKYLRALDAPAAAPAVAPPMTAAGGAWASLKTPPVPSADVLPTVSNPVRRLAARLIDETLYLLAVLLPLGLSAYGLNGGTAAFGWLLSKLLELLAEPLLLHLLGTTPGKALMGLRLTRPDGSRLSFGEGAKRLLSVYTCGLGLCLPLVRWYVLYRCLKRCLEDEPQLWDREIAYRTVSEDYPWWLILMLLALLRGGVWLVEKTRKTLPPNRGDLTVAEFAENVNSQKECLEYYVHGSMTPDGQWPAYQDSWHFWDKAEFEYRMEGETVTGVVIRMSGGGAGGMVHLPEPVTASAMALAWAGEDAPFWQSTRNRRVKELTDLGAGDWSVQWEGLSITCGAEMDWCGTAAYTANAGELTVTISLEE